MLKVRDKLPDFSCLDDKSNNVTQDDFKGKKVVLFFIPEQTPLDVQLKHVIYLKIMIG